MTASQILRDELDFVPERKEFQKKEIALIKPRDRKKSKLASIRVAWEWGGIELLTQM